MYQLFLLEFAVIGNGNILITSFYYIQDGKGHGANMESTWVLSAPAGPHIGPINLAVRDVMQNICDTSGICSKGMHVQPWWPIVIMDKWLNQTSTVQSLKLMGRLATKLAADCCIKIWKMYLKCIIWKITILLRSQRNVQVQAVRQSTIELKLHDFIFQCNANDCIWLSLSFHFISTFIQHC